MQDQPAQTQANSTSYVDAYLPPQPTPAPISTPAPAADPLANGISRPIVDPQAVALPKDPAANDQDAQKALDELAKMFETAAPNPQSASSALNQVNNDDLSVKLGPDPVIGPAGVSGPVIPPIGVSPIAQQPLAQQPLAQPTITPPEASSPMTSQPVAPSVGQAKSSDELLKEIEQALEDKRFAKPAVTPTPAPMAPPIMPPPVLKPSPAIDAVTPASVLPTVNPPVGPTVNPKPVAAPPSVTKTADSEALEDQNIFYLLGIDDGSQEQKDQFLNELQQVIWEDFLDHDVELLLTDAEYKELREKYQIDQKKPLAEQEEVIVYLEKLIPDLENLMLEKAIKLKADLVKERIASLKERFAADTQKMTELERADGLLAQDKWLSVARTLNSLQ